MKQLALTYLLILSIGMAGIAAIGLTAQHARHGATEITRKAGCWSKRYRAKHRRYCRRRLRNSAPSSTAVRG